MQFINSQKKLSKHLGLKILFVYGCLELGGAEQQGLLLAKHLRRELEAKVCMWGLSEKPGKLSCLCDEYNIPWRGIPFKWAGKWHVKLKELLKFLYLLRQEKPDVILPYTWLPNVICGLTWRLSSAKICIWNQRDEGRGLNLDLCQRLAIHFTKHFISNSTIGKTFLIETYKLSAFDVAIIKNGIAWKKPIDDRISWRKKLGIDRDCFLVCIITRTIQLF
jgi:hypothetical protein